MTYPYAFLIIKIKCKFFVYERSGSLKRCNKKERKLVVITDKILCKRTGVNQPATVESKI